MHLFRTFSFLLSDSKMPNSQIDFGQNIVLPLFLSISERIPGLKFLIENLEENTKEWQALASQ